MENKEKRYAKLIAIFWKEVGKGGDKDGAVKCVTIVFKTTIVKLVWNL